MKNHILITDSQLWINRYQDYLRGTDFSASAFQDLEALVASCRDRAQETRFVLLSHDALDNSTRDFAHYRELVDESIPILVMFDYLNEIEVLHLQTISTNGRSECHVKPYNKAQMFKLIDEVTLNYYTTKTERIANRDNKILIVDDEEEWLDNLSKPLMQERYMQVISKKSLIAAKEALNSDNFSLVISDLGLSPSDSSDDSGIELLQYIRDKDRKTNRKTPVIVVSSHRSIDIVATLFRNFGISDYYDKNRFVANKLKNSVYSLLP